MNSQFSIGDIIQHVWNKYYYIVLDRKETSNGIRYYTILDLNDNVQSSLLNGDTQYFDLISKAQRGNMIKQFNIGDILLNKYNSKYYLIYHIEDDYHYISLLSDIKENRNKWVTLSLHHNFHIASKAQVIIGYVVNRLRKFDER